jgi:hypothetical protein
VRACASRVRIPAPVALPPVAHFTVLGTFSGRSPLVFQWCPCEWLTSCAAHFTGQYYSRYNGIDEGICGAGISIESQCNSFV